MIVLLLYVLSIRVYNELYSLILIQFCGCNMVPLQFNKI